MMRGQTVKAIIFVAILALLAADISVGCGKNAYVYGPVEQKFAASSQEVDRMIMINGQTYMVPPVFFNEIEVGDTVKFNGSKWSIVKRADGIEASENNATTRAPLAADRPSTKAPVKRRPQPLAANPVHVPAAARDAKTAERMRLVAQASGQAPAKPAEPRSRTPRSETPAAAIPASEDIRRVDVEAETPPGPSMAEKVAPVLKGALASMARDLAVGAAAAYRWLVANVPVAARRTGRAARAAARWTQDRVRTWRRVAAEMAEERRLARRPRIEVPDGPLPDEEETVISRLKAEANGSSSVLADFPLRAYLTVAQGNSNRSLEFDIAHSPVLLGSADNSDISIPGIAPYEARLVYREGQFIMFSLTDVHGIRANGEAAAWAVLEDGAELGLGPYTLRFHVAPK